MRSSDLHALVKEPKNAAWLNRRRRKSISDTILLTQSHLEVEIRKNHPLLQRGVARDFDRGVSGGYISRAPVLWERRRRLAEQGVANAQPPNNSQPNHHRA